jgi:hypothetical protein
MRSLALFAVLAVTLITSIARADDKPVDQSVKMSPVALPIVADGRVVNYVFVEARILLTPSADAVAMGDKEPYFRDALVRAAHRPPYLTGRDFNHVDLARLKAVIFREASAIAGPNMIRGVLIESQTPQHLLPPPTRTPAGPHPATGVALVP